MLFNKKKISVEILTDIDISSNYWCNSAKLIRVNGTGAFETSTMECKNGYYGSTYLSHIKLNGVPIAQKHSPSCPTCASLLATGYGINNVDCPEIKAIQNKINSQYIDLDTSIIDISPILGLLQTGLYVIADIEAYPTDGNGHFFWEINDSFTENPATAGVLTADHDYVDGIPVYLYPTQDTRFFDENRVDYYLKMYEDYNNAPRTIIYNYSEFISLIIDGHHKTCAAAKLGKKVKCIAVLPYTGIEYTNDGKLTVPSKVSYSGIKIDYTDLPKDFQVHYADKKNKTRFTKLDKLYTNLINREWEKCYHESSKNYPNVDDFAEMILCGLDINIISETEMLSLFNELDSDKIKTLRRLLLILSDNNDARTKVIALKCAKLDCSNLKETAFKVLSNIKNDSDIEQFFIDYLVEDTDKHSLLRMIASDYWD
ncbi:MAG: hypothetical protein QM644_18820 [Mobilitalea sp.]